MKNLNMKVYQKMMEIMDAHPDFLTCYKNDLLILIFKKRSLLAKFWKISFLSRDNA